MGNISMKSMDLNSTIFQGSEVALEVCKDSVSEI